MIQIRLYKKSDQQEIGKLIHSIATEFKLAISNPNNPNPAILDQYWVSLYGHEIIGTIGVLRVEPNSAVLKNMFVQKEFRGKNYKIASLLLDKVFNWCNSESISTIYLGTMNQFKAAQKFYEKNGFEKINRTKLPLNFMANPIDTLFYCKNLN